MPNVKCSECDKTAIGRGLCRTHYMRLWRTGSTEHTVRTRKSSLLEAIEFRGWKVQPNGCWEYSGSRDSHGYGTIRFQKKNYWTHRVMFEREHGYSPEVVRHTCDNPPCMNPQHLRAGTKQDNSYDMMDRSNISKKTTPEQREEMYIRYVAGGVTQQQLAEEYGISQTVVGRIIRVRKRRYGTS